MIKLKKIMNNKKNIKNCDYGVFLKNLKNESIDFICIDPPYGKINGMILSGQKKKINWDFKIDWKEIFIELNRVLKKGGTIAVFGQQPTYSEMILANKKDFKYEYIWSKNNCAQGFHSTIMPLIYTENIAIFIKKGAKRTYNYSTKKNIQEIDKKKFFNRWYAQQLLKFINVKSRLQIHRALGHRKLEFYFYYVGCYFNLLSEKLYNDLIKIYKINEWKDFLTYNQLKAKWLTEKEKNKGVKMDGRLFAGTFNNILKYDKDIKNYHPTQKPLELIETLIKVYTKKGDKVLDCFFGSGTTWLAAKNLGRKFVGCEISEKFFNVAKKRIGEDE